MEEWRDIEGYEGLYQVSNKGRVRSLDRLVNSKWGNKFLKKGKLLKPFTNSNGYLRVILQNNGVVKNYPLHYLVIKTFIGEKPIGMQINHKDEDKTNNKIENLEYCTPKYNCNYGNRTNKIIQKRKKPVIALNNEGVIVWRFNSAKDAESFGFSNCHINSCCKGKRKTHKGLIWRYQ